MAYLSSTLKDILSKIEANKVCMPSIQRKYVWNIEKIENLFDSILKGYPIGTFLIWQLSEDDYEKYVFYRMKDNFVLEETKWQEKRPIGWHGDTWALLDGQQRLTSLNIGFRGSYSFKTKNGKKITKHLYYNLIGDNDFNKYEYANFKFLDEENAKNDPDNIWIKVNSFVTTLKDFGNTEYLERKSNKNANEFIENCVFENISKKNQYIISIKDNWNLTGFNTIALRIYRFAHIIHNEQIRLFNYYLVNSDTSLDTCTEIFVRINSGGAALSKADLLFSTVISKWEKGREIIDTLLTNIDELGFKIDSDFIMRTALYVTDSEILFNVSNFKPNTVENIIKAFETFNLSDAILSTFEFIKEKLGLTKSNLKSNNVVIPIIYHIFKCDKITEESIEEIQKYLYISLLQKIFGSHGDTLLQDLRSGATDHNGEYKFKDGQFKFGILINSISEERKKKLYNIDLNWIDEILELKKSRDSALVLSLVYGKLPKEYKKYDQDHLHPKSQFKNKYIPENGFIKGMEDKISNLGFLTSDDNRKKKRAKPLIEYYDELEKTNKVWHNDYKGFHKIEADTSLELQSFLKFYETRKQKIREILIAKFNIDLLTKSNNDNNNDLISFDPDNPDPDDLFDTDDLQIETNENDIRETISNNDIDIETIQVDSNLNKEKVRKLYAELFGKKFYFLRGEFITSEIYEIVKKQYPDYCDDNYLCITNCSNGNNSPEWQHRTRTALANLKSSGKISYNKISKKYLFDL